MSKLSITFFLIAVTLCSHAPEPSNAKRDLVYPSPVKYDIVYAEANDSQMNIGDSTIRLNTNEKNGRTNAVFDFCGKMSMSFLENETLLDIKRLGEDNCVGEVETMDLGRSYAHRTIRKNIKHVDREVSMIRLSFFGRDWVVMNLENPNLHNKIMVIARNQE